MYRVLRGPSQAVVQLGSSHGHSLIITSEVIAADEADEGEEYMFVEEFNMSGKRGVS